MCKAEITEAKFKPLTTKDVAPGIERKFSEEELNEYLERTSGGRPRDSEKVKANLKKRLSGKTTEDTGAETG